TSNQPRSVHGNGIQFVPDPARLERLKVVCGGNPATSGGGETQGSGPDWNLLRLIHKTQAGLVPNANKRATKIEPATKSMTRASAAAAARRSACSGSPRRPRRLRGEFRSGPPGGLAHRGLQAQPPALRRPNRRDRAHAPASAKPLAARPARSRRSALRAAI